MQIQSVTTTSTGLDVTKLVTACFASIDKAGQTLATDIEKIIGQGTNIDQGQMLKMQFQVGQYNAMLEMTSTVSKSLTDMMKTLAQRTS